MANFHRTTLIAGSALGFALAAMQALPARAADASPWVNDLHSGFRLIAGAAKSNAAPLRAGIEIKLQPGWHTYWRYAGDSGMPPRFEFAGSTNLASVKVRYPAPRLFTDETGNTLGYMDGVILPLEVTAMDPKVPVTLRLKLYYAVCEKLCFPAEGNAEITLPHGGSMQDAALAAAEARVPRAVSADTLGLSVRRVNDGPKPLVAVDLKAAAGKTIQVFAEGPTPEWALPIPKPAPGAPAGHQHFGFELDGLPPGVDPKGQFELTFTVVDGERAYEVKTRLD